MATIRRAFPLGADDQLLAAEFFRKDLHVDFVKQHFAFMLGEFFCSLSRVFGSSSAHESELDEHRAQMRRLLTRRRESCPAARRIR